MDDANSDGTANVLKRRFGQDPLAAHPQPASLAQSAAAFAFRFPVSKGTGDLLWWVEATADPADLAAWLPLDPAQVILYSESPTTRWYEAIVPQPAGQPCSSALAQLSLNNRAVRV